jgi:Zn-dependent protease/predicted transcriptional regulator
MAQESQPSPASDLASPPGPPPVTARDSAPTTGFRIGRVFGIPIYLHASWFIIFFLITLMLRAQFISQHPNWSTPQYWALGVLTSVLFFTSVVFHELSHSAVAKHYRIPVASITLFVFGGLARITREPDNAKQEFNIAIAGPLSSVFLSGCFWLITRYFHGNDMVQAAATFLWETNLALAVFNLVPGFPLDGGRILRGIVWGLTGNFSRATKISSTAGKIFAYLMIILGVLIALKGDWVNGLWTAFIGWFLLSAAQESLMQVAMRHTLTDVRAADIMTRDIPTVPRDMSVEDYVHEVLRTGRRCHIVTGAGRPVGLVTLHAARTLPREEWANTSIQAVMMPVDRIHSASPTEPALAILQRMQSEDINQMPVISDENIVGMIDRDTILRMLQTRLQVGHVAGQ